MNLKTAYVSTAILVTILCAGCAKPGAKDANPSTQSSTRTATDFFGILDEGDILFGVGSGQSDGSYGALALKDTVTIETETLVTGALKGVDSNLTLMTDPLVNETFAFAKGLGNEGIRDFAGIFPVFFANKPPGIFRGRPGNGNGAGAGGAGAGGGFFPVGNNGAMCVPSQGVSACHLGNMGGVCSTRMLRLLAGGCLGNIWVRILVNGVWQPFFNWFQNPGTATITLTAPLPLGTTAWAWGALNIANNPVCNCL